MQPVSASKFVNVSATVAATALVQSGYTVIDRVIFPQNATGTITFYDNAAGDNTGSSLRPLACTVGTVPTSVEVGIGFTAGLSYTSGGTSNAIVVFH